MHNPTGLNSILSSYVTDTFVVLVLILAAQIRTTASQELQDLVQQQQAELQQLQQQQQKHAAAAIDAAATASQQQQLETANAEVQQQLQGSTSRLHEVEAAMHKIMEQQVRARRMRWPPQLAAGNQQQNEARWALEDELNCPSQLLQINKFLTPFFAAGCSSILAVFWCSRWVQTWTAPR
jgi:septal ring factor EnvC (AmiA/AmiB activator)